MLVTANALRQSGFDRWVFQPGMRFMAPQKWWGDLGPRDFPHEGVDFCLYRNAAGQTSRLDEKSVVPGMADGVVRSIFKDFLGWAIIVEHPHFPFDNGQSLHTVYAHTTPRPGLKAGILVRQDDIIATIADTSHLKSGIWPHLHFTMARPRRPLPYVAFYWNIMRDPGRVTLLDPEQHFSAPSQNREADCPSRP
jgi:murein DD-endopeptidase MepM/ murein hydrolase activator NlpD